MIIFSILRTATNLRKHLLGFFGFLVLLLLLSLVTGCQSDPAASDPVNTGPSQEELDAAAKAASEEAKAFDTFKLALYAVEPVSPLLGSTTGSYDVTIPLRGFAVKEYSDKVLAAPGTEFSIIGYSPSQYKVTGFKFLEPGNLRIAKGEILYTNDKGTAFSKEVYFNLSGTLCSLARKYRRFKCEADASIAGGPMGENLGYYFPFPFGIEFLYHGTSTEPALLTFSTGSKLIYDHSSQTKSKLYTRDVRFLPFHRLNVQGSPYGYIKGYVLEEGGSPRSHSRSNPFSLLFRTYGFNYSTNTNTGTLNLNIDYWYLTEAVNSQVLELDENKDLIFRGINPDERITLRLADKYLYSPSLVNGFISGQFYGDAIDDDIKAYIYFAGVYSFKTIVFGKTTEHWGLFSSISR